MTNDLMPTTAESISPSRKIWIQSTVIILRRKTFIVATTLIVTILASIYYFAIAKTWYKAKADVLPALHSSGLLDNLASGFSSTIKDLGLTKIAGRNKSDNVYSPLALGLSRNVQESLVKEFNMMKVYESATMDDAVHEFSDHATIDVLEEGDIGVTFEDTDPKRAAAVANRMVAKLNEVNSKLAMEEARFNKTYIEKRYTTLLASLDSADKALGEFQKKYGVYELKSQAQAQLLVLSSLEQQRYLSEIQLANAIQLYGDQAPEVYALKTQVAELHGKLEELRTGMDQEAGSYFVPNNVMPDVALQYLKLMREEEIQSKLKAFLLPSYEQAKMDETKQSLAYLMLDSAQVPLKKARPKRSISILLAGLGAFGLSTITVLGVSKWKEVKIRFEEDRATLGL